MIDNSDLLRAQGDRYGRALVACADFPAVRIRLRDNIWVEATVPADQPAIPIQLLTLCHLIRIKREGAGFDVVHDTRRTTPYWEAK